MSAFDPLQTLFPRDAPHGPLLSRSRLFPMPTAKDRAARRDRHSAEVEASQVELRKSIRETERLLGKSEDMLRRHRSECEDADKIS